jgi:hypothetical protein
MPSSDPYATAPGGTALGIGASNNRLFETGWSNAVYTLTTHHTWRFRGGLATAGGGPSLLWRESAYQEGVIPPALTKSPGTRGGGTPTYSESDPGGTSVAAPLVAGMVTAARQGQPTPFGFLNPVLYKLYGTDVPRHAAAHRSQPGAAARRGLPRRVRPELAGHSRLPESQLQPPGYTARLRQHDRPRHAQRASLHPAPAPTRRVIAGRARQHPRPGPAQRRLSRAGDLSADADIHVPDAKAAATVRKTRTHHVADLLPPATSPRCCTAPALRTERKHPPARATPRQVTVAEDGRFELPRGFPQHAFQACALGH